MRLFDTHTCPNFIASTKLKVYIIHADLYRRALREYYNHRSLSSAQRSLCVPHRSLSVAHMSLIVVPNLLRK